MKKLNNFQLSIYYEHLKLKENVKYPYSCKVKDINIDDALDGYGYGNGSGYGKGSGTGD